VQPVDRNARWHRTAELALLLACAFFAFKGWRASLRPEGSDFTIYWHAGRAVLEGTEPWRVTDYIYLPAFAVAIVPLAALPLPLAAAIWQLGSLGALFFAAHRCVALARRDGLEAPAWLAWVPLFCLLRLADSNLVNAQVNAFILAIALLGIDAWFRGRERRAGAWIGLAAAMKLVPVALVLPIFARRGYRTVAAALATAVACVFLLPPLVLGWSANVAGLRAWWHAEPEPYWRGGAALLEAREYLPGQSLTATAYRLLAPTPATARGEAGPRANVLDLDVETVAWIVRGAQAVYLALLGATLLRSRRGNLPGARLRELALTMTVALTLAPLVHKAHLIWLLLPYTVLLARGPARLAPFASRLRWTCITASVIVIGATTPAILGRSMATWELGHNAIFFGVQLVLAALFVEVWGRRSTAI